MTVDELTKRLATLSADGYGDMAVWLRGRHELEVNETLSYNEEGAVSVSCALDDQPFVLIRIRK